MILNSCTILENCKKWFVDCNYHVFINLCCLTHVLDYLLFILDFSYTSLFFIITIVVLNEANNQIHVS